MKHSLYSALIIAVLAASASGNIFAAAPSESDQLPVERYALYIACNDGGKDRETLRYASSDANRLAKTMNEVGGIKQYNSMTLIDPTKDDIDQAFETFTATIERNKDRARRTEFLFYYSGHSDEKAFLLGDDSYDYSELKTALNKVPSDVHVVMLDSCYSGNFVRAKGGSRQKPFLMDDSTVVSGHAYLSSSSDKEASQESDSIQSSYFTHAIINGLRGAADTSGDNKVSLNELYHYAFNETLSDTELSTVGPQHPSYNITLVGSGDLVLTDIAEAESMLMIPAESEGRFFIRDANGLLVSEINKIRGTGISLAISAGTYTIVLVTPKTTMQGVITIRKGERISVGARDLSAVQRVYGRARGNEIEADQIAEDIRYEPFAISLVPGVSIPMDQDNARISVGIFMAKNVNVNGFQANTFMGITTGRLDGIQGSGFMNLAMGPVDGIQGAGYINVAMKDVNGVQGAGFMNMIRGSGQGVQGAGFMNLTVGTYQGAQFAGFMNVARDGMEGMQGAGFMNITRNDAEGFQAAGFMNIAGEIKGCQTAGFMNIADRVDYLQLGIINIAKENNGAAIGVLNFIANGIMSPAVYMDSSGYAYVQYQGGTKMFFTTFFAGINTDWCQRWDTANVVFGSGIGARLQVVPVFSIDFEILWKSLVDFSNVGSYRSWYTDNMTNDEIQQTTENVGKSMQIGQVPAVRATANFSFAQHFSLFASANVDARIHNFNDAVFTRGQYTLGSWEMVKDRITLYPTISLGLKF